MIDEGLQKYPTDDTLIRLFQSTMAAQKAFEKDRALKESLRRAEEVETAVREGEDLLREKSYPQASAMLQSATAKYPDAAELQRLLARAAEAHREEERRRFIEDQLARAAELENAQQWEAALRISKRLWPAMPMARS